MTLKEYAESNIKVVEALLNVTDAFNTLVKDIESRMDIKFCDHYSNKGRSFQMYQGIEYLAFVLGANTRVDGREKIFEYNGYTFYQLACIDEDGAKYWE